MQSASGQWLRMNLTQATRKTIRTWWWLLGGAVAVRQATEREDGAHMLKVAEFGVACMVAYLITVMLA